MSTSPLTLAEELSLLAHRDSDGKRITGGTELAVGVAGALVAELALTERITLDTGRVTVRDRTGVDDPELDDALTRMRDARRPRKPDWWITRLNTAALSTRLKRRLVERGVLRVAEHRMLGVVPRYRHPALDPQPGQEIRTRVRAAIDGERPDARTAALIAVLHACGLDRTIFDDLDRTTLRNRAARLAEGDWTGPATPDVVRDIQAVATAAATAGAAAGATGAH